MAMAVYAPDSNKSLKMYEECVSSVAKVLREGRKGGARDFFLTGELNVESQALKSRQERGNFAAGLHYRTYEKKRRHLHPQRRKTMGNLGPLSYVRGNTRRGTHKSLSKKESKVDGLEADNRRSIIEFYKGSDERERK